MKFSLPHAIVNFYRSGKNIRPLYWICGYLRLLIPRFILNRIRRKITATWQHRSDADFIRQCVELNCLLDNKQITQLGPDSQTIASISRKQGPSTYYIDAMRYLRYFPAHLKLNFFAGDVWTNPDYPTITKARRLDNLKHNGTLLNLDCVRHFIHPHDNIAFADKRPQLIFRGDIHNKPNRIEFFRRMFDSPLCDLGDTTPGATGPWVKPRISIADHFAYQFILALEGNDVASALQWIMGSHSIAVMPRPSVENWLLHSQLKPGVHYIEIASDFSDVEQKLTYYTQHPDKAEQIAIESQNYYRRFYNRKREKIISLLTLERYFKATGQEYR